MFGDAEAAATVWRPVAPEMRAGIAAIAEIGAQCGVSNDRVGSKVALIFRDGIDQPPKRRGIARAVLPTRKETAAVGEGQRDAQIHSDQRIGRQIVPQHGKHLFAGPAMADQDRGPTARIGEGQRDAFMPFALRSRPVDGEEMLEPPHPRSRRSLSQ